MNKDVGNNIHGLFIHAKDESKVMASIIKKKYKITDLVDCFSENVLCEQFYIDKNSRIMKLNLESGESELVCNDICELEKCLTEGEDANYFLANSLLSEWSFNNKRVLKINERLLPVTPFIAGGLFDSSNLHAVLRQKAVNYLIDFHKQTKDLQEKSKFELQIGR